MSAKGTSKTLSFVTDSKSMALRAAERIFNHGIRIAEMTG